MVRRIALTLLVPQGTTGATAGALTLSAQPEVAMARAVVQMLLELCAAVSTSFENDNWVKVLRHYLFMTCCWPPKSQVEVTKKVLEKSFWFKTGVVPILRVTTSETKNHLSFNSQT